MYLDLNVERARQLQVHTLAEGGRVASGEPAALAYYERWGDPQPQRDAAILDSFVRRTRAR